MKIIMEKFIVFIIIASSFIISSLLILLFFVGLSGAINLGLDVINGECIEVYGESAPRFRRDLGYCRNEEFDYYFIVGMQITFFLFMSILAARDLVKIFRPIVESFWFTPKFVQARRMRGRRKE